ncbi:MAG TPA: TolC family protein [Thermoanaerobaculia bacterium]|nr:TolC family protein [Thermoanaerobaculia bacterium]
MNQQRRAPGGVLASAALLGAGLLWAAAARPQELPEKPTDLGFGSVLERQELLAAVLERNPGVAAARQAWEAARARIPQAESLEDPMASYALAPLSVAGDARFGDQLRVGQRLPFPGTLRLRGEVAAAEAAAAGQRVEEVRLRLATMASLLFDDYYLVARALEVNAEHLRLLEDVQSVAVSRYGAGLAPQQAPIQAEVEAAHLLHRQVVLETDRRTLVAQLNALLHREPRAPLPAPPRELSVPPAPAPEAIAATILAARPELQAQRAEIEARRAAVELKQLGLNPDFEVMTSYNSMWGMEEHRLMVGVGVNLPIWRKRIRAGVAEAEARLGSAESELARLEDEVQAEAEVALQNLHEALHVVSLYRNRVLPAARDQIAAARAGFETGANTMVSLIDAERSLRTAELNYYQAFADANTRRAELDRALGRLPFAAAEPEAASPTATEETEMN